MSREEIVYLIIDNIEGGYYHPDMKSKLKNGDALGISGETMYGIDRTNGAPLFTTGTPQAVQFWQIVDDNYATHHADTAYYNDKADGAKQIPASVGAMLKPLAAAMIVDAFERNSQYLSSGAREIVFNNPRLLLQFLYATYNGSGNFKTFADVVNAAYSNGERSAVAFWNLVQAARRNKGGLFAVGADKLDAIAASMPEDSDGGGNWILWLLGGGLALLLISNIVNK